MNDETDFTAEVPLEDRHAQMQVHKVAILQRMVTEQGLAPFPASEPEETPEP